MRDDMKKNKHLMIIGTIILLLFFLSREPFLARTMSTEEKLRAAIEHTICSANFTFDGTINHTLPSEKKTQELIDDALSIQIKGEKSNKIKDFKIVLSASQELEDIELGHYYEDKDHIYLITPFKTYEKMVFKKNEFIDWDINALMSLLRSSQISLEKNHVITINKDTYDAFNIITDCYTVTVDINKVINQCDIFNEKLGSKGLLNYLTVKIYVDEAYYIRKIESILNINQECLSFELQLNNYGKEVTIKVPDTTDAHIVNESLEKWLLKKLK